MASGTTVLFYSAVAVLTAALGIFPCVLTSRTSERATGWLTSVAAGLMLALAYALADGQGGSQPWVGMAGGLLVIFVFYGSHHAVRHRDQTARLSLSFGHAAVEGGAIGAAFALDAHLGVAMAITLALHNVPEVAGQCAKDRGPRPLHWLGIALLSKSPQVPFALLGWSLAGVGAVPSAVLVGGAVGGLAYLVLTDLLPNAYRGAGPHSIALVTVCAMGALEVLRGVVG